MTLREQLEQQKLQWQSFNKWEDEQPPGAREPSAILADLEWLRLLSADIRGQLDAKVIP
ncbi:MAG TPA: hypothetical protein VK752_03515 [Bryobacteraceae bacterium]|nr:hypothetical protein [Bryobacteraceae bacterium]